MFKAFAALGAVGFMLSFAGPAGAETIALKPSSVQKQVLTFKVAKLPAARIRQAKLTNGRRSRRISVRQVRTAIVRGRLRVRRLIQRRKRPERFVVVVQAPAVSSPAPAPVRAETPSIVPAPVPAPAATATPVKTPTPTASPAPAPVSSPAPTPTPSAVPPPRATLRPVGSAPLADAEAARRVRRSTWEPRTSNTTANRRVPTSAELSKYRATASNWTCKGSRNLVTGKFTGTTDEVLQWAAWKWGLDEETLRAVAKVESDWKQSAHGDIGAGESYGLMQVKKSVHTGTYPLSSQSSAFNADYYGMVARYYYDGCGGWLNTMDKGRTYAAGDMVGSLGAWYAGRWYTTAATGYATKVKDFQRSRPWATAGF